MSEMPINRLHCNYFFYELFMIDILIYCDVLKYVTLFIDL